jgi:two-component system, response regulator
VIALVDNERIEILLIEDNPRDAELAMHALGQFNLTSHVKVLRDGAEALDFLFATGGYLNRDIQNPPKVILLDLKLPKIDGREVLRRLKSDRRTMIIPVVVFTSSREQQDIVETYMLGVNSYIVKPMDFEQFTEALRQLGMYWVELNQSPLP